MRRTGRPRSGAERQAAHAERQRRLSPLQRALRQPSEAIYAPDELALLARILRLREQLQDSARRLNARLQMRLLAESVSPEADAALRAGHAHALNVLAGLTFLSLPRF